MKLLSRDEHGWWYLAQWEDGYIRIEFDWPQWFRAYRYNWLMLRLLNVELEVNHKLWHSVEFTFIVLGVGLFFWQQTGEGGEWMDDIENAFDDVEYCDNCGTALNVLGYADGDTGNETLEIPD